MIVAEDRETGVAVAGRLLAAGVWNLAGIADADLDGWDACGIEVRSVPALTPEQVASRLAAHDVALVDVRDDAERRSGHVAGSLHLPLCELGDGRDVSVPDHLTLAVACAAGRRAALAASVLRRRGHANAQRVTGGIEDLARRGDIRLVGGDRR